MNKNSQVSIITPVFNCANFLSKTIESICEQSFQDWELILVDDCSTDNSAYLIQSYITQDSRIFLVQLEQNFGAAVARNRGIKEATGRYIAFLDSDDVWYPEKLLKQLQFMRQNDIPFSFTRVNRVDEQGNPLGTSKIPDKVDYSTLLKTNVVVCSSAMYDTQQLGKVYMPNIRKRQDFALWLRLLKLCDYGYGLHETLVKYTVRDGSVSSNRASAASYTWRVYREIEQLGLLKSLYYFSHYAVNAFIRIKLPRLARKFGLLDLD